ncbi:MAG: putative Ig domain-containing protein [Rhodobacter sp.]|nr:putative Ig domain-containing protein [Rhodobacter sp.]
MPISLGSVLKLSTALTSAAMIAALLAQSARANPVGGEVVAGDATIVVPDPTTLLINQTSDRVIINWDSFNIDPGETTTFVQPNIDAWALNRVTGSQDPSAIAGTLNANGNIAIVNPDGVIFSFGSRIDVNSLIATTADTTNQSFMAGELNFNLPGNPSASIVNEGEVTIGDYGLAAFVAPGIRNSGVITARFGTVSLAAGNQFTLDLYGDGLVSLAVDDEIAEQVIDVATGLPMADLVKNDGTIRVEGGTVALTAATARTAVNSVVNNTGVIEAHSVGMRNGRIILGGQTADTRSPAAPAQNVHVSGTLSVAAPSVSLRPSARPGTGGTIQITGEEISIAAANIDASGAEGGGTVLIGGDYLGGRDISPNNPVGPEIREDYEVANATTLTIDVDTEINASATENGDGGKIIAWSEEYTLSSADILATESGDGTGGFIETSSAGTLSLPEGLVTAGEGGLWLLDPDYLRIISSSNSRFDDSTTTTVGDETTIEGSTVLGRTISAALDTGTNVTIIAGDTIEMLPFSTARNGPGISKSVAGQSKLSFIAGNTINFERGSISANSGAGAVLDLHLQANNVDLSNDVISLNGGTFSVDAKDTFNISPRFLQGVGSFKLNTEGDINVGFTGSPINVISGIRVGNILSMGGNVELMSSAGRVVIHDPISKTAGNTTSLHFTGTSLAVRNSIISTSGRLNLSFAGLGDSSVFTLETGVRNGSQVFASIDTNGGTFLASAVALQMPSPTTFSDGTSLPTGTTLAMPTIKTHGGGVTLNFQESVNSRTINSIASPFQNFAGCMTSVFCSSSNEFVVDAGGGEITVASNSTATEVNDMPLLVLSDRALKTTGTLVVRQVNVDERRATFSGATQFDGPGNGVNAVEVGALDVQSGDFDVADAKIGTTPPPPVDNPPTPTPGTITLPNAEQGTAYSATTVVLFSDDNGVAGLTLVVTGLPAGLTATDNGDGTVTISGTPTVSGAVTITVTATDGGGNTATVDVDLIIDAAPPPPPTDTAPTPTPGTITLPNAEQGTAYSETTVVLFSDDNGVAGLTLVVTGLPAGLTATDNGDGTVTISGTPTVSGAVTITVTATDAGGNTATVDLDLTIDAAPPPPPVDTPPTPFPGTVTLPNAEQGTAYNETTIVLFSDDQDVSGLTLVVSGLSAGLTATDNGDGTVTISGTPTVSGAVAFTVTATDAGGNTASIDVNLTVDEPAPPPPVDNPPTPTAGTVTLPDAERGSAYNGTTVVLFSDDNGVGGLTLVVSGLPAGLSGTDNGDGTVTISGTPTVSGPVSFTVTATDAGGNTASIDVSLTVDEPAPPPPVDNPPTVIGGSPTLPNAEAGTSYTATTPVLFADDNGVAGLTLVVSGLPAGLTATDNGDGTVTISGTPAAASPVIITVTATDASNNTVNTNVSFTIKDPTVTPPEPPTTPTAGGENGTAGQPIDNANDILGNASTETTDGLDRGCDLGPQLCATSAVFSGIALGTGNWSVLDVVSASEMQTLSIEFRQALHNAFRETNGAEFFTTSAFTYTFDQIALYAAVDIARKSPGQVNPVELLRLMSDYLSRPEGQAFLKEQLPYNAKSEFLSGLSYGLGVSVVAGALREVSSNNIGHPALLGLTEGAVTSVEVAVLMRPELLGISSKVAVGGAGAIATASVWTTSKLIEFDNTVRDVVQSGQADLPERILEQTTKSIEAWSDALVRAEQSGDTKNALELRNAIVDQIAMQERVLAQQAALGGVFSTAVADAYVKLEPMRQKIDDFNRRIAPMLQTGLPFNL